MIKITVIILLALTLTGCEIHHHHWAVTIMPGVTDLEPDDAI